MCRPFKASVNSSAILYAMNQGIPHFCISSKSRSLDSLLTSFYPVLAAASRADKSLEWQLAALDAFSIWLLRATRSTYHAQIASHISPSDWDILVALTWTRWASAPNANAIQKLLKEIFSKILTLQRNIYSDWNKREVALLERVAQIHSMDMKVQCYLTDVLVRRTTNGAKRLLELHKDWVGTMLGEMKDSGTGPAIGKCIVSVLMARRAELIADHNEVECSKPRSWTYIGIEWPCHVVGDLEETAPSNNQ